MPKPRIKIAYVIDALPFGGAERMLFDLTTHLPKDRYEPRVYAVVSLGPMQQLFADQSIPVKLIGKNGKLSLGTIKRLQREFDAFQPDLVHTHLFAGDTYGQLAARWAGIPSVSTKHYLSADEGAVKLWIRWVLSHVTLQIVAVSKAVETHANRVEHIRLQKLRVIYNGVDSAIFSPLPLAHEGVVIGMTSRLHPQKGHTFLLQACLRLKQKLFRLLFVGDGPLRTDLVNEAKRYSLGNRAVFLGESSDIPHLLGQMDIVVLPTTQEGFGLSVVEAMMMGKPVVAFKSGAMVEIIEHGVTGYLVPERDVVALSKKLDHLIDRPDARKRMGEMGRRRALQLFSLDRMVKQYDELYREILKRR